MCTEPQRQPRPTCILVVEHNPLQQSLLDSASTSQNHTLEVSADGMGVFSETREDEYDLVIVDYQFLEAVLQKPGMWTQLPQSRSESRRCGWRLGDLISVGG